MRGERKVVERPAAMFGDGRQEASWRTFTGRDLDMRTSEGQMRRRQSQRDEGEMVWTCGEEEVQTVGVGR